MLSENDIWFWKSVEKSIVDHCLCSLRGLLTGLEDYQQSPLPIVSVSCKESADINEPCDVPIMTARVGQWRRI